MWASDVHRLNPSAIEDLNNTITGRELHVVTKKGTKKGLWDNINARQKAGTSRPKSESTVDPKALKKAQAGSKKKSAKKGTKK